MTKFAETGVIIMESRIQTLGTLNAATALLIGTKIALTDAFRMLKAEIMVHMAGMTSGEQSRLALYLCHGDLSLSEIAGALAANGPPARGDIEAALRTKRPIFLVGQFVQSGATGTTGHLSDMKTGSAVGVIKPRWTFPDGGVGWNWVIWNFGNNLATGGSVQIQSKAYGLWVGA